MQQNLRYGNHPLDALHRGYPPPRCALMLPDGTLPFDAEPLRWLASHQQRRSRELVEKVIAELPSRPTDEAEALRALFHLDHPQHFLRAPPSLLDRQHEPQVTRSFRNFLLQPATRLGRTQAIFDAVLGERTVVLRTAAAPMADDPGDRIDLFVHGRTYDDVPCGLAIEAKFGHRLNPGQLTSYRKRALRHLSEATPPLLFLTVIAPVLHPHDKRLLAADARAKKAPPWRFLSWQTFLLRLQASLPPDLYDDAARSFFKLVWDRANEC